MREFVGIKSPIDLIIELRKWDVQIEDLLKREALMFSRISCPFAEKIHAGLSILGFEDLDRLAGHLSYLEEHGLLFTSPPLADGPQLHLLESDSDFQNIRSVEQPLERWILESIQSAGLTELLDGRDIKPEELGSYLPKIEPMIAPFICTFQYHVRRMSIQLRVLEGLEAYPVFSDAVPQIPLPRPLKCDAVDVTLSALPVPDTTVSWEQIWEYRSDPDSQKKFTALRTWMSGVARAQLTPAEMEEQLEYLLENYRQHLQLHRMKANTGALQTVVMAAAEFLEDLANKRFSKIAKGIFSANQREIELLQGELTAPGKEVAYIVKSREAFNSGSR